MPKIQKDAELMLARALLAELAQAQVKLNQPKLAQPQVKLNQPKLAQPQVKLNQPKAWPRLLMMSKRSQEFLSNFYLAVLR